MEQAVGTPRAVDVGAGIVLEMIEGPLLEQYWPHIWKQMQTVPHTWTHWTPDFIYSACRDGTFQVWGAGTPEKIKLIVFTQLVFYPIGKVMQTVWAGGNSLDECLPILVATLERFGSMNDCKFSEVVGRPGWGPKLKGYGYKERTVIFAKPLPAEWRMN